MINLRPSLPSPCTAARYLALAATWAAALGAGPIDLRAQDDPLTLREVLELRRRGVSSRQILRNAQQYCIAFVVNDTAERQLVAVGADTVLIGGMRESCVATSPSVRLAAGVLADDNFAAMSGLPPFAAGDHLCTARAGAGGLRVENRRGAVGCAMEYPLELGGANNVRLELTVTELQGKRGAMAALGFGKDADSWDQYSFGITNEGLFELCMSVRGRCQQLLFQKRVAVTHAESPSATRLTVEIRGREVFLYIDDQRVGTYSATHPVVGGISLGVGSASTAVFSRLRVERLEALTTSR
jgi:hypothetical protein